MTATDGRPLDAKASFSIGDKLIFGTSNVYAQLGRGQGTDLAIQDSVRSADPLSKLL